MRAQWGSTRCGKAGSSSSEGVVLTSIQEDDVIPEQTNYVRAVKPQVMSIFSSMASDSFTDGFVSLIEEHDDETAQSCALDPASSVRSLVPDDVYNAYNARSSTELMAEAHSVFQFAMSVYYVEEEAGQVRVDVMRIGSTNERVWVEYATDSSSAQSDVHFAKTHGVVVFAPGEYINSITVPILTSGVWVPPLDFTLRLEHPSAGAALNVTSHLDRCRVWILHHGPYPTEKIRPASSRIDLLVEVRGRTHAASA